MFFAFVTSKSYFFFRRYFPSFATCLIPLNFTQFVHYRGLSSSNIIWALHSETETELLNAIPGLVKSQPTWDEMRALGVAWWLKNNASLCSVVEKVSCFFSLLSRKYFFLF